MTGEASNSEDVTLFFLTACQSQGVSTGADHFNPQWMRFGKTLFSIVLNEELITASKRNVTGSVTWTMRQTTGRA